MTDAECDKTKAQRERERRQAEKAERCALAKCPLAGKGDERCEKCRGPVSWTDEHGRRTGVGGDTHRRCTDCPMNGLGLPVCWAGCDGPSEEFGTDGKSMVTLGGMDDPCAYLGANMAKGAAYERTRGRENATALPVSVEDALLRILRIFAGLSQGQVLYLHARLNSGNASEAARMLGFSKQNAQQTGKRAARRFPELKAFFDAEPGTPGTHPARE